MKKWYLIIFLILGLVSSCDLLRSVSNNKKRSELTQRQIDSIKTWGSNSITTTEQTRGGKLTNRIIPKDERKLDSLTGLYEELVQKYNDGGLTKTIYYRPDGSVDVECEHEGRLLTIIEKNQWQAEKYLDMLLEKSEKEQQKDSDKEFKTGIDWTFITLGIMAIIGVILFKKL